MKKSKYEVFVKVVELGSLSRAADYCNYSQSAVSQIVSSIENELGITLLNRNHAGVWLTSDGEQLLPHIHNLSNAHTDFDSGCLYSFIWKYFGVGLILFMYYIFI